MVHRYSFIASAFASAVIALFVLTSPAQASLLDQVHITYWAGTGENVSILVTDFGDASFAFGYRWDGAATAWDMMQAIDAAGELALLHTDFGGLGILIDEISYDGHAMAGVWPVTYLGWWTSDDGLSWTPSGLGVAQQPLSDGGWYGWSVEDASLLDGPFNAPRVPLPEPASLALVAAGAALVLGRRNRAGGC